MSISFNSIPNLLLTPGVYIEIDSSRAVTGLAPLPNRVLLIGGRLASGTVGANTLVQLLAKDDGARFHGRGSQLDEMCRAFKAANPLCELWSIGVTGAGTAATKTITVTGTATSAGTLHFLVNGKPKDVAVAVGDTPTIIAASIDSEFAEEEADWMYTFGAAVGVVTGTSRHLTAFSEDFDIRLNHYERQSDDMPAAVTVAIANGVAGATNPSIATALAALGDQWFTKFVMGFADTSNIALAEAAYLSMWGPMVQHDGVLFYHADDVHADILTLASARNSQFTILSAIDNAPQSPWIWASVLAAVDASEPDPARPRQTLRMVGLIAPRAEDQWDRSEREFLLEAGVSTYTCGLDGTVYVERIVTTYKTNASGTPDTAYRNIETMHTLAAIRYTTRVRFATKYPRCKLADDGTDFDPGQVVMTPKVARGEILALGKEWEGQGWIEDFDQFKSELIVERNASDRDRLDARLGPNLVNQFRVMAAQLQYIV